MQSTRTLVKTASEAWLRLAAIPSVNSAFWYELMQKHGLSAEQIFHPNDTALPDAMKKTIAQLLKTEVVAKTQAGLRWLQRSESHHLISLTDENYPDAWRRLSSPPLVLFAIGQLAKLSAPILAIVGSRKPTPAGVKHARQFAQQLSAAGITVASGLALGIDGAAHEAAMHGKGGTLAILGSGIDIIYPHRHRLLAQQILEHGGLLLSAYFPGDAPLKHHFPSRNRLIASLSLGTLVIEAALRSGSLITAGCAVDYGRDVFALPGSIDNPMAAGCHRLIQQGAKLVTCIEDVVEEYKTLTLPLAKPLQIEKKSQECLASNLILDSVDYDPTSLDTVIAKTGISASEVSAKLLELELEGRVAPFCGGYIKLRG